MLVGHILVGRAMLTPGSYRLPGKTGKSKERPANIRDEVKRGRPATTPYKVKRERTTMKKKKVHRDIIRRQNYTELDIKKAIRLLQEDGLTILMTASFTMQ